MLFTKKGGGVTPLHTKYYQPTWLANLITALKTAHKLPIHI
jgi:hypothetical protein